MSKALFTMLLAILPFIIAAQISNLRSKKVPVLTRPQLIDTLTVVPNSVEVTDPGSGEKISSSLFIIENNTITFDSNLISQFSTLHLKFRVLPFDLSVPVFRIDTSRLIHDPGDRIIGFQYDPYATQTLPLLPQHGLDYNGTFSRGLAFGNNQSLVLNSQFNLQMAGSLGDLEILAAISDNNIPIQPEGNTRQLREFDKVFIQISKEKSKLIAGDYELSRPNGYFMNYFKKLQGATFSWQSAGGSRQSTTGAAKTQVPGGSKQRPELNTQASVAIARGKFARNVIQSLEGNQGPYRMQGAEGERFIIILAGTEKVYIDGQLLIRGLEYDYVIDYNAGHISFTNRRLITKDSRIIVEFDYADQNFQRSLYAFSTELKGDRYRVYLNTYSEQDSRQPVDDEFSQEELKVLRDAGDNSISAVVNSVSKVEEFSAFRVLYRSVDTLVDGTLHRSVLVFSSNKELAKNTASFSNVGPGNGNYLLDTQTPANGRVYRWVAPDPLSGQPRGDHEPVRQLVAPKVQQLYTAGGVYKLSKNTSVRAEAGLSNFDQNRLSNFDDGDNIGLAVSAGVKHVLEFGPEGAKRVSIDANSEKQISQNNPASGVKGSWSLETEANYEFTQQRFKELNPYRPAEFTRDWNINRSANDVGIFQRESGEHLAAASLTLRSPGSGNLDYRFSGFFRDSIYTGTKHFAKYSYLQNGYDIRLYGDLLTTNGKVEDSRFFRPKFNLGIPIFRDSSGMKYWKTGLYGEREDNRRFMKSKGLTADSLSFSSFYYDVINVFIESPQSEFINFRANALRRFDYSPVGNDFEKSTLADEINIQGDWRQSRNSRLAWNFTHRRLAIQDTMLSNLDPSATYIGRLDYTFNILRGLLQSGSSYEIGSGQERKAEFTYLEVPAGEGTHQWLDRNGDGVVQVDEIEIAPFRDLANALRVRVFTDDFIRTNNVQFNQSLRLEPRAIWFNASGAKKLLSKFSTQSSFQINRKVRAADGVSVWNPFQLDIVDSALVATRASTAANLFFNRADPKYDIQLGMSGNQNKFVLTTGFESRRQQEKFLKLRWNISRVLGFNASVSAGLDEQDSEQFESKRYHIRFFETKPQLTYQASGNFRTVLSWRYKKAENELSVQREMAHTHDIKIETVYNQSATTSIRGELSLVSIDFDGQANSPVGFAFLQGLQNGKNFLWNINIDRQVAKNIRMGISYEGRKTGSANIVHVGRAQMAAVF